MGWIIANSGEDYEPKKKKRARDSKGRLKADDPSTPDINEAWEQ